MGEAVSGTWSLTLRDESTGVTGHLMNWNLSPNSQVVVETFERGLDIPGACNHWPVGQADPSPEVLDIDKECRVTPDTGQCFCRHRWTNERLSVPYRECVALARRP